MPVKRIQAVLEMKPLDYKDMGPCGGFSTQYACYCDYYNMPYREEVRGEHRHPSYLILFILQVAWDVDTIYFSHDTRELALTDFEHLDQRDLICIIRLAVANTSSFTIDYFSVPWNTTLGSLNSRRAPTLNSPARFWTRSSPSSPSQCPYKRFTCLAPV